MKALFVIGIFICSVGFAKEPKWMSSPAEFCSAAELCAVGEGSGTMMAESAARNEISKIFETRIKAKTTVFTNSESLSDADGIISAETVEDVTSQVEEKTQQVLKGVVIRERYESDDATFALASLNKRKAAKTLKSEMKSLDNGMLEFLKDGTRNALNKILKDMKIRETLNLKYEFLHGGKYPPVVTYAEVMKRKRAKRNLGTVVFISVVEPGETKEIKELIITKLLENDFRVVTDKSKKFKYRVKATLESKKQHMNVKGFEKYKFTFKIESQTGGGRRIGKLDYGTAQMGRNFKQAYDNALPFIAEFIYDKIGELNID